MTELSQSSVPPRTGKRAKKPAQKIARELIHYSSNRSHEIQLEKVNRQITHNQDRLRQSIDFIQEAIDRSDKLRRSLDKTRQRTVDEVVSQDPPKPVSPPKLRGKRVRELVLNIEKISSEVMTHPFPRATYPPFADPSENSKLSLADCSNTDPLPPSSSESDCATPPTDRKVLKFRSDSSTVSSSSSSPSAPASSSSSLSSSSSSSSSISYFDSSPKKSNENGKQQGVDTELIPALKKLSSIIEGILQTNPSISSSAVLTEKNLLEEDTEDKKAIEESKRLIQSIGQDMNNKANARTHSISFVPLPPPYDPRKYAVTPLTLADVVPHFAEKKRRKEEEFIKKAAIKEQEKRTKSVMPCHKSPPRRRVRPPPIAISNSIGPAASQRPPKISAAIPRNSLKRNVFAPVAALARTPTKKMARRPFIGKHRKLKFQPKPPRDAKTMTKLARQTVDGDESYHSLSDDSNRSHSPSSPRFARGGKYSIVGRKHTSFLEKIKREQQEELRTESQFLLPSTARRGMSSANMESLLHYGK